MNAILILAIAITLTEASLLPSEKYNENVFNSCLSLSSSDYSVEDLGHKIRVDFDLSFIYPVTKWDTNNTSTTELDADLGDFAYFVDLGLGFLEISMQYDTGNQICQHNALLYY